MGDTIGGGRAVWDGAAAFALARRGHLITITGDVQRALDVQDLLQRGYQLATRNAWCLFSNGGGGYHQYTQPGGNSIDLDIITDLVTKGSIKPIVDKTFGFSIEEVKQA